MARCIDERRHWCAYPLVHIVRLIVDPWSLVVRYLIDSVACCTALTLQPAVHTALVILPPLFHRKQAARLLLWIDKIPSAFGMIPGLAATTAAAPELCSNRRNRGSKAHDVIMIGNKSMWSWRLRVAASLGDVFSLAAERQLRFAADPAYLHRSPRC